MHLEVSGYNLNFCSPFGEAVGLQDSCIVCTVGYLQFCDSFKCRYTKIVFF